ncbi:MAG: ABC transporter permease subunit [Fuerstiella sp.]|nr:ABC transporter permease subunit [Fuerstiella sp.]
MSDKSQYVPSRESSSRTWRLATKELREILRDRRTVITLVLMPLLVYPLLGVILRKGLLNNLTHLQKVEVHVCLETKEDSRKFAAEMIRGEQILDAQDGTAEETPEVSAAADVLGTSGAQEFDFVVFSLDELKTDSSLEQQVTERYADIAVRLTPVDDVERGFRRRGPPFLNWQILRRDGSALSDRGYKEITKRLDAVNERYVDRLLERKQLSSVRPATVSTQVLSSNEAGSGSSLITFIPLVLVLMTMTGAVYPAIDLTAGERERGTMEILVAAPVSRMTLLAGKFVAVLTVALLTTTMNLISMFATLFALGLEGTVLGNVGPTMVVQVIVLMVVFAAFFSAVLLSITSVARSFKEAQAYLVPLMLISLTPGVFSLMPNLQINGILAVTPLVNTVLMGRDLLQGDVNLLMFAIVLISTALYGVLALAIAARIFGSDAVLYGSGGTLTELFKRPQETIDVASIQTSMSCLAIVFSLFIVAGSIPSRLNVSLSIQLLAAGLVSLFLFVLIPACLAVFSRVHLLGGFSLRLPKWWFWLAAVLLGGSLWPYIYELEISILTDGRIEELKQIYERFEGNLKAVPLWIKLVSLAVAPAACEEFFFRGFFQNSIRVRTSATMSILSSAVLFGLFHVIVKDALFFERLLPSTLMGIVLGIVFERSGSVLPGMLLHVMHNGLLIIVSEFESELTQLGIGISDRQHLPASVLIGAAMPIAVAVMLLTRTGLERPDQGRDDDGDDSHDYAEWNSES